MGERILGRRIGVLCVAAFIVAAPAPASASVADSDQSDSGATSLIVADSRCEVESKASKYLSDSELLSYAFVLDAGLQNRYPDSFGGLWVDEEEQSITIGVVESGNSSDQIRLSEITFDDVSSGYSMSFLREAGVDAELTHVLLGECGFSRIVSGTAVEHTYAELQEAQSRARTMLRNGSKTNEEAGILYLGIDVRNNSLTGGIVSDGPAKRAVDDKVSLSAALGTISLKVELNSRAGQSICNTSGSYLCDKPIRSGVGISGVCTSAFPVVGDSGTYYLLTAGHCSEVAPPGYVWYTRDTAGDIFDLGPSYIVKDNSDIDAQIIKLDYYYGATPRAWQYKRPNSSSTSPDTFDDDYTISYLGEAVTGTRVCFTGRGSGSHCDVVSGVNMDFLNQVGTSTRFETRPYPGDSGAGVFGSHKAYGVITGHSCNAFGFDCDGFYSPTSEIFVHLSSHIHLADD